MAPVVQGMCELFVSFAECIGDGFDERVDCLLAFVELGLGQVVGVFESLGEGLGEWFLIGLE